MSEILVPPGDVMSEVRRYGQVMLDFVSWTNFPEPLLTQPDHLMIKTETPSEFDKRVKDLTPWAERAAFVEVDTRFLVAAQLVVPLALTDYRHVEWIEVMESKSPDATADYLGAEYVEFYVSDFNKAGQAMKKKRIPYEKRVDESHR